MYPYRIIAAPEKLSSMITVLRNCICLSNRRIVAGQTNNGCMAINVIPVSGKMHENKMYILEFN